MIRHALALAARGFPVFPCRPNTKVPAAKGWQRAATTDTHRIVAWWRERPNCNIGCLTGHTH